MTPRTQRRGLPVARRQHRAAPTAARRSIPRWSRRWADQGRDRRRLHRRRCRRSRIRPTSPGSASLPAVAAVRDEVAAAHGRGALRRDRGGGAHRASAPAPGETPAGEMRASEQRGCGAHGSPSEVPGIDVLILAHTHAVFDSVRIGATLVTQAGTRGEGLGRVTSLHGATSRRAVEARRADARGRSRSSDFAGSPTRRWSALAEPDPPRDRQRRSPRRWRPTRAGDRHRARRWRRGQPALGADPPCAARGHRRRRLARLAVRSGVAHRARPDHAARCDRDSTRTRTRSAWSSSPGPSSRRCSRQSAA